MVYHIHCIDIFADADREHQQIVDYMKSDKFLNKNQSIKANTTQLKAMQSKKMSKEETRTAFLLDKAISIDKREVDSTELECSEYLQTAVSSYMKTILLERDEHSSATLFRIFSLWFTNHMNEKVTICLQKDFPNIATHKFVPLMPQISSRLSNENTVFSQIIESVVGECCELLCKYLVQFNWYIIRRSLCRRSSSPYTLPGIGPRKCL